MSCEDCEPRLPCGHPRQCERTVEDKTSDTGASAEWCAWCVDLERLKLLEDYYEACEAWLSPGDNPPFTFHERLGKLMRAQEALKPAGADRHD